MQMIENKGWGSRGIWIAIYLKEKEGTERVLNKRRFKKKQILTGIIPEAEKWGIRALKPAWQTEIQCEWSLTEQFSTSNAWWKTFLSLCLSVFQGKSFTYYPNPVLFPINRENLDVPFRFKPGGVIAVEVQQLSYVNPEPCRRNKFRFNLRFCLFSSVRARTWPEPCPKRKWRLGLEIRSVTWKLWTVLTCTVTLQRSNHSVWMTAMNFLASRWSLVLSCWLLQGIISKAEMLFRDFPARLVYKGQWFTHSHTQPFSLSVCMSSVRFSWETCKWTWDWFSTTATLCCLLSHWLLRSVWGQEQLSSSCQCWSSSSCTGKYPPVCETRCVFRRLFCAVVTSCFGFCFLSNAFICIFVLKKQKGQSLHFCLQWHFKSRLNVFMRIFFISSLIFSVFVLLFFALCRRKSKQALRDYKKVLLQLETLEINVGDQCRKEFTGMKTHFKWTANLRIVLDFLVIWISWWQICPKMLKL